MSALSRASKFPWKVGGLSPNYLQELQPKFVPLILVHSCFNMETLSNFGNAYFDIVDALADKDLDALENFCEKRLFQSLLEGYKTLDSQKLKLRTNEVENEPDTKDVQRPGFFKRAIGSTSFGSAKFQDSNSFICYENENKTLDFMVDARAIFGVQLDREQNDQAPFYVLDKNIIGRKRAREYHFSKNMFSPLHVGLRQILVMNIYVESQKKLWVEGDHSNLNPKQQREKEAKYQEEKYSSEKETHMLRFETNYKENATFDWRLTDIDNWLKGNDYYAYLKKEE